MKRITLLLNEDAPDVALLDGKPTIVACTSAASAVLARIVNGVIEQQEEIAASK